MDAWRGRHCPSTTPLQKSSGRRARSFEGIDLSTVYVEDEHGNQFGGVKMIEQTLTDGSKVYNLVLTMSA